MEVILQTKVPNLGTLGDRVKVKGGYARNYLLPKGMAVTATPEHIKLFETRRAEFERKMAESLAEAQKRAEKLRDMTVTIAAQASDEGKLYGSVGTADISRALTEQGNTVQKREIILLNGVIRSTGEHEVHLQLHSDIVVSIKVNVVKAD